jgi:hypothetical protein
MSDFEMKLKYITDFGLVEIKVKANRIIRAYAVVTFWDQDYEIGAVLCEIGDFRVFEAFSTIVNGYLNSPEFIQKRREAGTWN